jgi:hypothetical protein
LEQYFTCSQCLAHFFRQTKSRSQTGQRLLGKSDFFIGCKLAQKALTIRSNQGTLFIGHFFERSVGHRKAQIAA